MYGKLYHNFCTMRDVEGRVSRVIRSGACLDVSACDFSLRPLRMCFDLMVALVFPNSMSPYMVNYILISVPITNI